MLCASKSAGGFVGEGANKNMTTHTFDKVLLFCCGSVCGAYAVIIALHMQGVLPG